MPECPNCGHQLTGTETACPACAQPLNLPGPPSGPSQPGTRQALPVGNYIKTGWELFKQYPWGFIGFFLLNVVIHVALYAIPYVGWIADFAISPALIMGNFIVSAKLLQRQSPTFRDFFAGFTFWVPLLLLSLVVSLFVGIGLVLLIIPGVYLAVAYLFASCLAVDQRLDFWSAMELSRRTVNPHWFDFFAFMLLLVALNLAGALLMGLGLLVTVPLSFSALAVAYADIFGFQSDYSQEVPRVKTL